MPQSTKQSRGTKPKKPYDGFPLFAHQNGQWAKKIRNKLHYFGLWGDPDSALKSYLDQRDDLHAGRKPQSDAGGFSVRDLANRFLTAKTHQVETGEISKRTFDDYHAACERITSVFGLTRLVKDLHSDDFQRMRQNIAITRGPVALGNEIQRIRTVFKYASDADLIEQPVRFGPLFKRPAKHVLRKERQKKGPRMYEATEVLEMINEAFVPLDAMILLGINCGFGNSDCGNLPRQALDLKQAWLDFPRPKTGVPRRCKLWPETVAALKRALEQRHAPTTDESEDLVFVTESGYSWAKDTSTNPISKRTTALIQRLGFYRPGLGFYALRHTFETIGGESRDQVAVDHVMGHARDDMASVYRERISDERLVAVTDHIRQWLYGDGVDEIATDVQADDMDTASS